MSYSKLIAGTMTWGQWGKKLSSNEMIDLMHHCINHSITTFDHADIYGGYTTEKDFGDAFAQSNINREDLQLISKCGIQMLSTSRANTVKHYQYDSNYIIASAEQSLKNLRTEYLDLLLLHRPSPLMRSEEISKAFETLKGQGKVKQFGVSNFTPSQIDLISNTTEINVNQIEFSLTEHQAMLNGHLDYLTSHRLTAMAWSPLGNVFKDNDEQTKRIHIELEQLTEKYKATKDQLLLAWILKHPSGIIPVIGTTNKNRISDSMAATNIDLELQDWFKLLTASLGNEVP